jgi:hypothetical protein
LSDSEEELQNDKDENDLEGVSKAIGLDYSLRKWALNESVNHKQLDSLLKILKLYHPELPLSSRTVMKTPRKTEEVVMVQGGEFIYVGIENQIRKLIDLRQVIEYSISK